jgi:hypothetical protein
VFLLRQRNVAARMLSQLNVGSVKQIFHRCEKHYRDIKNSKRWLARAP